MIEVSNDEALKNLFLDAQHESILIELHFQEVWPESKVEVEQGINIKIILSFIMKLVVDI